MGDCCNYKPTDQESCTIPIVLMDKDTVINEHYCFGSDIIFRWFLAVNDRWYCWALGNQDNQKNFEEIHFVETTVAMIEKRFIWRMSRVVRVIIYILTNIVRFGHCPQDGMENVHSVGDLLTLYRHCIGTIWKREAETYLKMHI